MKVSFVFFAGLAARGASGGRAAAGADDAGRTHARATAPGTGAPAPQPTPPPCPGMAGLEIGQTRTFSFERMALLEPAKKTVTRDLKVVHTPAGRPWTVDVTYASDALDAKVVALHYLLDPPSGLYEGILERYGKGTPVASEPGVSSWDVPFCVGRDGCTPALPHGDVGQAAPRGGALGGAPDGEENAATRKTLTGASRRTMRRALSVLLVDRALAAGDLPPRRSPALWSSSFRRNLPELSFPRIPGLRRRSPSRSTTAASRRSRRRASGRPPRAGLPDGARPPLPAGAPAARSRAASSRRSSGSVAPAVGPPHRTYGYSRASPARRSPLLPGRRSARTSRRSRTGSTRSSSRTPAGSGLEFALLRVAPRRFTPADALRRPAPHVRGPVDLVAAGSRAREACAARRPPPSGAS